MIGNGRNLWDVVRVEDVAVAFRLAAEDAADGTTYHVADDEPITFGDFVGAGRRDVRGPAPLDPRVGGAAGRRRATPWPRSPARRARATR